MKNNALNDEQLILLVKSGDSDAMTVIMEKYRNLVKKRARTVYLMGGENEDLIQEGMIGLYKAITSYDANSGNAFAAYADSCVSNQIYSAVQASNRKKHGPLNSYISLYGNDDVNDGENLLENLELNAPSPLDIILDNEHEAHFFKIIDERLSAFEKKVLRLYLEGFDYDHIAEELNKPKKSVDNALQRIKNKLKNEMS